MGLRDVTRAIIAQAEHASGYPVLVTEDRSLRTHAAVRIAAGRTTIPTSKMTYAEFLLSQPMIDAIDIVLARHYSFTDEELDFIPSTMLRAGINYDIKYRLGRDGAEEAEE